MWRTVAKVNNLKMEEAAVVLEDVQFRRATIVPRDAPLRFLVSLLGGGGAFEVCEGGAVVATGRARLAPEPALERLPPAALADDAPAEDLPPLDADDVYKELRLRGYHYRGAFRGITHSDARGTRGLLAWEDNWISFMDTMLQFGIIGVDTRELYLPTRLQRALIDPAAQRAAVAAAAGAGVPVRLHRGVGVTAAGGVELRGVKTSLAPRRGHAQAAPQLEKYAFVPLDSARVGTEDTGRSKRHALAAALQLALENAGALRLRVAEAALGRAPEALLLPAALALLEAEPQVRVDAALAAGADAAPYAALEPLGVRVAASAALEPDCHLALGADVLARHGAAALGALAGALGARGFVLLEEPAGAAGAPGAAALLAGAGLRLVARQSAAACEYVLLRRAEEPPAERVVLEARDDDFSWVEPLRDALRRAESEELRVYVWSGAPASGVLGLGTCLRREAGGERLRVYHVPGAAAFDPAAAPWRAQAALDLAANVRRAGVWGTMRHLPLEDPAAATLQVEHAYVNTLTRGDLASLRWVESDLRHAAAAPRRAGADLCRVYYAPLNFRDVMLATGKLPPDALPGDLAGQECILGLEFSGRSSSGRRVMGMVAARGLATTVLADEGFMWDVPPAWSLEEAATVPVAYATAYYALAVRGRMRRGEAVLVHAGTGGVGQAAIAIALHAGCTVFTTVGTADKRAFLRERFPELPDAHVGNSRDCSFEQLVLRRTRGRGVDLVLNSLAGDKLQASLRCLAAGGRFLEIGKLDLSADSPLGMAVLLKNTAVHGILLDALFDARGDHPEKAEVVRCVSDGIAAGAVRPLPATVYGDAQLEQAFR